VLPSATDIGYCESCCRLLLRVLLPYAGRQEPKGGNESAVVDIQKRA
jgi:hypothetical protein